MSKVTKKNVILNANEYSEIIHVADIHIRNLKLHNEYETVFELLYKEIAETKQDSLIIIAGDLLHNKLDLSPELVSTTIRFLNNLLKLRDVVLIPGNHDANLNNSTRLDALTPLVEAINNPNLYYLPKSGIYSTGNIRFFNWSLLESEKTFPKIKDKVDGLIDIILFHGVVNDCFLGDEFRLRSTIKQEQFANADLGILGDIHKFQYLNKDETIAYSSSLICQNFGEHPYNHGYILWDLETLKGEFRILHNDYVYLNFKTLEDYKTFKTYNFTPKFPKIKVGGPDYKKIVSSLKADGYNTKNINIDKDFVPKTKSIINKANIHNLNSVATQNNLISDYSKHLHKTDLNNILELNKELNKKLTSDAKFYEENQNIVWKPIKMEWSNLFSYGEDNQIEFQKLDGLFGIFSKNHTGKSSIVEILFWVLFDQTLRTSKTIDILNVNKDDLYVKIQIEIEGVNYFIERIGTRFLPTKKSIESNIKVHTNFWSEDETGEKINLNGEMRRDTNNNIRNYIGTVENFLLTSLSLQNNNIIFINNRQGDKKQILTSHLNLDIFDKLYTVSNDELKSLKDKMHNLSDTDIEEQIEAATNKEHTLQNLNTKSNKELEDLHEFEKTTIHEEKLLLRQINESVKFEFDKDIDELENDLQIALLELDDVKNEHHESEKEVRLWIKKKEEIELPTLEYDELKLRHKILTGERDDCRMRLSAIQSEINNNNKFLEDFSQIKINPDCSVCYSNNEQFILRNEEITESSKFLQEEKDKIELILNHNEKLSDELNKQIKIWDNLSSIKSQIWLHSNKSSELQLSIGEIEFNIDRLNKEINDYRENQDIIVNNVALQEKLDYLDTKLEETKDKIKQINTDVYRNGISISNIESSLRELELTKSEYFKNNERFQLLKQYSSIVSKNGIQLELITDLITLINIESNTILGNITDFTMELILDSDDDVQCYLKYPDGKQWNLEMASGMEKFITSLALRITLYNISSLPKPNFLIVDEGFGNLDSESLNMIGPLFESILKYYKFIIIITHIDSIKDITNNQLTIDVTDGYSNIYE